MNIGDFFRGYVKYEFECSHPEGYINDLRKLLPLRHIKRTGDKSFSLVFYFDDREKVAERQRAWKVNVIRSVPFGLPYIFHKYRKRTGLFVGVILGAVIIYISSLFVWEVSIEGNENVSTDDIYTKLCDLGFHEGVMKKDVNIQTLHNNYLIADRRMSWIFVNFDGTTAHVEVKEAKLPPERQDKQRNTNIVASRDGIILRVDALDGGKEVRAGEVVSRGQLLISAFLETRKSGFVIRNAKGSVWAKTNREYIIKVPFVSYEKQYTGSVRRVSSANILGRRIPVSLNILPLYKYYDRTFFKDNFTLFGCIRFPIMLENEYYREYIPMRQEISEQEALKKAKSQLSEKIKAEAKDLKIIQTSENYKSEEGFLIYNVNMDCVENIAQNLDFEIDESGAVKHIEKENPTP